MNKLLYSLSIVSLLSKAGFAQCNQVVRRAEKQGDRVIIKSISTGSDWTEPVQYKQVIEKGVSQLFVQLCTAGGSLTDKKGAAVFFNDGSVLEWPEAKVKVISRETSNIRQYQFKLAENEIEQFQEKEITRIKVFTQERSLTPAQSQRAQDIINCIIYADYCDIKSDRLVNQ